MPEGIQSTVRLFADDTIAYVTISSDADAANLQQDLDKLAECESKWLIKCHPEKCNVLNNSKKRSPSKYNYTLHGHILEHDTSAKYLGCTISSDLKWVKHISTICSKANNTISFLKRNINISNKSIKEKAYMFLVRPTLEYASAVWDPYQQNDIHRLEMAQRRAARYVTNRYHNTTSISSMIEQLEWTTLQERRKHSRLLMIYKLKNNIVRVDASSKFIPNERPSRNNNEQALRIPSCKTTVRKESLYPRTIKEHLA
jgi:hypothetical protein